MSKQEIHSSKKILARKLNFARHTPILPWTEANLT